MRVLVGLTVLCFYLLGFGTAFWLMDVADRSEARADASVAPMPSTVLVPELALATTAPREAAASTGRASEQKAGTANPGVTSEKTTTFPKTEPVDAAARVSPEEQVVDTPNSRDEPSIIPPRAVALPSAGLGRYGSSRQSDWVMSSADRAAMPAEEPSLAEQTAGLYEVERPVGVFYTLAVAEFAHLGSAQTLRRELEEKAIDAEIFANGPMAGMDWYTVAVGRFADRATADRQGRRLGVALGQRLSPILLRLPTS